MPNYQQVSVDLFNMVYTAIAYFALAGAVWLFLRLIQACFWLPNHMKRQNDVEKMLAEKVDSYENYIKQCEEKEAAGEILDQNDDRPLEVRKKERQECLDMMKKELTRIRNGGDPYDFNYLLEEEEKKLLKEIDEEDEREKEREKIMGKDLLNEVELEVSDKNLQLDAEPKKDK